MPEKNLTEENFDKVIAGDKLVLVDFWAPWCGPCQMMGQIVEELSKDTKDATVAKVNIDENPEIAGKYNVMSVPTFLLFKAGKVVDQVVGAVAKESLSAIITKHIDKHIDK